MTNEKLESRIKCTKQQIAEVNYALAFLEEQRAVKQLRLDAWHTNSHSRLARRKAALVARLAATKRAKQRNKPPAPSTDTRSSIVETGQPTAINPK